MDDKLYLDVLKAYVKKMRKALKEYEGAGERGKELADQLRFEVEYFERWLPSKLDEAATRELVTKAIAELGVKDAKQAGRVVGQLMKSHNDQLDGGLVNRLVRELLV